MTLPEPKQGKWHDFLFRYTPTIFLAEPFQCFLIGYATATCISILNGVFFNPTEPQLYSILPDIITVIWALSLLVGAVVMGTGLIKVSRTSALSTHSRKWELIGLIIIGVGALLYGVVAPLRLSHADIYGWGTVITSILTVFSLVVAITIRATLITSSVFLLAVSRLTRIRLMKEALRNKR